MPRHSSRAYLIPHLLRTLFRPRVTVHYPYGPLSLTPAYRGEVICDIDACTGCGLCARDCPSRALKVERKPGGGVVMEHLYDRCSSCGQCEIGCRRGAISLAPSFVRGVQSRDSLVHRWEKQAENADATDVPADAPRTRRVSPGR